MNLFDILGFRINTERGGAQLPSVINPANTDGSVVINNGAPVAGGWQGYAYDTDNSFKTEVDLVKRYREVALFPEVDSAIQDIVNEAIVSDQDDYPVKLQLDQLEVSDNIKKMMQESFEEILNLLNFNEDGHDIFQSWYTDGRQYWHILFEGNDIANGIAEIRRVDPLKIKKVKNIHTTKNRVGVDVIDFIEEYYIYNDKGISESALQGVKLTTDSVVMITSGLSDVNNGMVLGNLHKAIKPVNQLRMLEDAIVIHTLTKAPDRRIFYIDVGNLPKIKAEQYVTDIMNKFKNKLVYNAVTGEIADAKKNISMIEDFWMPRRDGGKGTEITTLQGSQSLIQADFVQYFQDRLYNSLNVPIARFKGESGFSLGHSQETTREELKFFKFINRQRVKFSKLFHDLLRIQLIAKGIIRADEWYFIRSKIRYDYVRDNHFTEMKDSEIMMNRMQTLQLVDPYLGKYYSKEWVQKNILCMDEEEIEQMQQQIEAEGEAAVPTEVTNMEYQMQLQQQYAPPMMPGQAGLPQQG